EQAVSLFLDEKIQFLDIPKLIEKTCDKHQQDNCTSPGLDDILAADKWARQEVLAESMELGARILSVR
ncbi:MAG: 1-deoxy-D-xylulose-5-phosphate reductoisomerase, partial [Oscillatoriales cyanobacterium]